MANEEKKGGFFAGFRKSKVSGNEGSSLKASVPPSSQGQNRNAAPENKPSSPGIVQPKPVVVPKAVSAPAVSEPVIDTFASFNFLCSTLIDIGASQLKVVDMTLTMLSSSIAKIAEGLKKKG